MHRICKIIGILELPISVSTRKSCGIRASRQFTERIQVTRARIHMQRIKKKFVHGISVTITGNALLNGIAGSCTYVLLIRYVWMWDLEAAVIVRSPPAAPWFLSLPEMSWWRKVCAVLSRNNREEMTASDIQRERETSVSFSSDLEKSKLVDNARLMSDRS